MEEERPIVTRKAVSRVLRAYWQMYKSRPGYSLVGLFLPAIGTILGFFVPPLIVADLINTFAREGEIALKTAGLSVGLFAGLWLAGEICWRIGTHFVIKVEAESVQKLNRTAFRWLINRDDSFYTNNFVGTLTKKGLAFARGFEIFTDTLLFNVVSSIIPMLFAIVVLWRYSPWIPMVLLFWIAAALAIGLPIIRRRSKLVAIRHDAGSKMAGKLADAMTNMPAIKAFASEKQEMDLFGNYADDLAKKAKRTWDYQNLRFDAAISPIYVASNAAGLILAILFAGRLELEPGMIFVVFSYYAQVTQNFWRITHVYRNIESSVNEAAELTQLFLNPPSVRDKKDAKPINITNAEIEFENVSFRYVDNVNEHAPFLNGFNLKISGGEKIGLVGPSGGGKSTITKLLLRLSDVQSGKIKVDSQDISTVTQESLRKAIAYVPQDPLLFHRSLFENIAYGSEDATEKDVVNATELAHAHEFISSLAKGYGTLVGERGIRLSGGQRQRVAIARALLKKAPILVLDEATSSLDSESEKYIQEGLWELMKGKTALVVAHRLSTIKHLDRIVVLDNGHIVEDGTHDELIEKDGLYARLWRHQSGEFIGEV